jgi:hypothetical protein
MPKLDLFLGEVKDPAARENFDRIATYTADQVLGRFEGRFLIIEMTASGSLSYPHSLNFIPTDVIVTAFNTSAAGDLTFQFPDFTDDDIVLTNTAGAATIRLFVGRYVES